MNAKVEIANKEIVMNTENTVKEIVMNTENTVKETAMNNFKNDVHELLCTEKWNNIFNKYEALNDNDKAVWEMWYIRKTAIAHLTKLNNYTTVDELRNSLNTMFNLIVDEVMPTIIKNKIENDEKRIEKENAKKEREEKRAAEKAEKEKIKAENAEKRKIEKAEKDAKRAAEKAEKKTVKTEKNAKHNVLTALLKTNAAKIEKPVVTTETSENA